MEVANGLDGGHEGGYPNGVSNGMSGKERCCWFGNLTSQPRLEEYRTVHSESPICHGFMHPA